MEQKNWARERELVGYYRYDTPPPHTSEQSITPDVRRRPNITMNAAFKRLKPAALSRPILALTGELERSPSPKPPRRSGRSRLERPRLAEELT